MGGDCDLFGMSNNAEIIRSRKEIESKLNDSVFSKTRLLRHTVMGKWPKAPLTFIGTFYIFVI